MPGYKLRIEGLILTYVAIHVHTNGTLNQSYVHAHVHGVRQSQAQALLRSGKTNYV